MSDAVSPPRHSHEKLTADAVADYLKNHPGFFQARDDLLLSLELTHPHGGAAISLLERQVSILRERNMAMRERLASLVDNARRNDRLFDQTRQLILALLETTRLDALAAALEQGLIQNFDVDFVSLILFGSPPARVGAARVVPSSEAHQHIGGLLKSNRATCGVLRREEFHYLFPEQGAAVGSAAAIPLVPGPQLGMLAIGSRDPEHFRSSMGTLFLSYLAEVLGRLLPAHLRSNS